MILSEWEYCWGCWFLFQGAFGVWGGEFLVLVPVCNGWVGFSVLFQGRPPSWGSERREGKSKWKIKKTWFSPEKTLFLGQCDPDVDAGFVSVASVKLLCC